MASEIAQAYVQIMPSARGIKGSLEKSMGGEARAAGHFAGRGIAGGIKKVIAAAGIGTFLAKSLKEGAALEQSIGGIETLFGEAADVVKQRADEAFRTAGMSANQYMELSTSFAASLLQSLGGDTAMAADISDMAMTDMSDNANKMGTDMERITDAYKGFARNQYTMLDNLKLGYGGTKGEMQRLLSDAQEISGVEYNIDNLSDVYSAIHVIQQELGITGTTALEAETTISGSAHAMKAAFSNVLGKLALGQDIGPALDGLMQTVVTFAGNLVPAVANIFRALPGAIATVIQAAVPQLLQTLSSAGTALTAAFTPQAISSGAAALSSFLSGIIGSIGEIAVTAFEVVTQFGMGVIQNLPQLISAGMSVIQSLIAGIGESIPNLISAAGQAVITLLTGIIQNLPQIISAGFELITSLISGIVSAGPGILDAVVSLMQSAWEAMCNVDWASVGTNIVSGIINGLVSMGSALWEAAKGLAHKALDAMKGALGISSPSKVMRDEVGRWIPAGVAEGIEHNTNPIRNAMRHLADETSGGLPGALSMGLRPAFGAPAMAGGPGLVLNVYSHDSLSESELTREAEDMLDRQRWGLP